MLKKNDYCANPRYYNSKDLHFEKVLKHVSRFSALMSWFFKHINIKVCHKSVMEQFLDLYITELYFKMSRFGWTYFI